MLLNALFLTNGTIMCYQIFKYAQKNVFLQIHKCIYLIDIVFFRCGVEWCLCKHKHQCLSHNFTSLNLEFWAGFIQSQSNLLCIKLQPPLQFWKLLQTEVDSSKNGKFDRVKECSSCHTLRWWIIVLCHCFAWLIADEVIFLIFPCIFVLNVECVSSDIQ